MWHMFNMYTRLLEPGQNSHTEPSQMKQMFIFLNEEIYEDFYKRLL